jgi:hypothetical protein
VLIVNVSVQNKVSSQTQTPSFHLFHRPPKMETGSNKRKQLEAPFEVVVKKQRLMAETTETVDRWLAECNKYKMMFSSGNHSQLTHLISLCLFVSLSNSKNSFIVLF